MILGSECLLIPAAAKRYQEERGQYPFFISRQAAPGILPPAALVRPCTSQGARIMDDSALEPFADNVRSYSAILKLKTGSEHGFL